jgi:hypothetical protein
MGRYTVSRFAQAILDMNCETRFSATVRADEYDSLAWVELYCESFTRGGDGKIEGHGALRFTILRRCYRGLGAFTTGAFGFSGAPLFDDASAATNQSSVNRQHEIVSYWSSANMQIVQQFTSAERVSGSAYSSKPPCGAAAPSASSAWSECLLLYLTAWTAHSCGEGRLSALRDLADVLGP